MHPSETSLTFGPIKYHRFVAKSAVASHSLEWLSCSDRERPRARLLRPPPSTGRRRQRTQPQLKQMQRTQRALCLTLHLWQRDLMRRRNMARAKALPRPQLKTIRILSDAAEAETPNASRVKIMPWHAT